MSPCKVLEEVWRWKEEVSREAEKMPREKQLDYFHQASQRLAEKTGKALRLPEIRSAKQKPA
jgi:hypothetical protein